MTAPARGTVPEKSQNRRFPLIDETTTVLGRTWEAFSDHAMRHGSEVRAAARFMGYLPYFADLPARLAADRERDAVPSSV